MEEQIKSFKKFPNELKPRERLEQLGVNFLTTQELLAIVLRTGGKKYNVMELSQNILSHFDNLFELKLASLEELKEITGVGRVKAIEIQAVFELGKRLNGVSQIKLGQAVSSQGLGEQLVLEMQDYLQEHLVVLYLNTKNEIIKKQTIFIGSLNQSVAHPREIFRIAVKVAAARIIVAHNHPSGNPEPSEHDCLFTQRLVECGRLLGIDVLDHLVIGSEKYVSFQETNQI